MDSYTDLCSTNARAGNRMAGKKGLTVIITILLNVITSKERLAVIITTIECYHEERKTTVRVKSH